MNTLALKVGLEAVRGSRISQSAHLLSRSLHGFPPDFRSKTIAVAMSGGVDSSVTAHILRQQGHSIFGIFMQNWDEVEERGNCSGEQDLKDAEKACERLGIELHTVNFVKEYWTEVFSKFTQECERGLTPNPDLLCNKAIKFDLLLKHASRLGGDILATGHYARLQHSDDGSVQLLRGLDRQKDQSYFLASVPGSAFRSCVFPLGMMHKQDVREIAVSAGLHNADRRSSAGICFIGRRKFGDFIADYITSLPGRYVDVDSGKVLGDCPNIAGVTYGQRAGPGGASDRMFVAGKDIPGRIVYLALGQEHPALYTHSALLRSPSWISGIAPAELDDAGQFSCQYKARYGQEPSSCMVSLLDKDQGFDASCLTRLMEEDMLESSNSLQVSLPQAARAITPQQEFVMYDGDICLGSAAIAYPGKTLHEPDESLALCC